MIPLIVTFGGAGRLPWGPGTWGSAAAIPVGYGLHIWGGFPLIVAGTLLLFSLGLWAVDAYLEKRCDDPPEVVIDEAVGMLLALWPLSFGLWLADANPWVFPLHGWAASLAAFRFFDVLKPPPVSWFDRPGALFVMLDDVVAGALGAALVSIVAMTAHG